MATFKSSEKTIASEVGSVYRHLSNPQSFNDLINNIPDDLKLKAGNIHVDGETVTLNSHLIGDISFKMTKRVENERIRFEAVVSPLPFSIEVLLAADSPATTKAVVEIKIELNPIIKPMVSKPLQEAAEKFGDLIAFIPYGD